MLKRWILMCCLLAGLAATGPADAAPNILFFYGDDWGRYAGVYADPDRPSVNDVIKTPSFDRIAREGVLFTNAFYPIPQCAPCRGSLTSGRYFWNCGKKAFLQPASWQGHEDPFLSLPRFGESLAERGYFVARSGKSLDLARKRQRGVGASLQTGYNPDRYGHQINRGERLKLHADLTEEEIAQARAAMEKRARGFITQLVKEAAGKPFFWVFGPIGVHRPYVDGSGKRFWGIEPDDFRGRIPAFLPDQHEIRSDYADYFGEIQSLDWMMGLFMEELTRAGLLKNTLIVASGDNGMPGMPRGKTQLYDLGIAAPLMVRWPGKVKPGRVVDDFINLMDVAPTFIEAAGGTPPASMEARSFLPQLLSEKSGQIDPARDFVVVGRERHVKTARQENMPYPARAIRTREFLYIRNFKPARWPMGDPWGLDGFPERVLTGKRDGPLGPFPDWDSSPTKAWFLAHRKDDKLGKYLMDLAVGRRPAEELYDLAKDPDQVKNVAAVARYAEIKRDLGKRLMKVLEDSGDPRLSDAFDAPPYVDRVQK